jgi:hypothetical protein
MAHIERRRIQRRDSSGRLRVVTRYRMRYRDESTAAAVGNEPRNPFHTFAKAYRARLINRRRYRLPLITAAPRRTHARA